MWNRLCLRIDEQRMARGMAPAQLQKLHNWGLGLMLAGYPLLAVFCIGIIPMIIGMIFEAIFIYKLQESINELARVSMMRPAYA